MRHNQNRRSRGRSRKGPNPLTRSYESNGPDVKVRGTAAHVAEKYTSLARDAQAAGDIVAVENYLQHAEHYNRIVMAAQAQFQQSQPQFREGPDEGYDDDRQTNGRDRFDYNGDGRGGDDNAEERFDAGEADEQPGYRPMHTRPHERDPRRGPRHDRFERRERSDYREGGHRPERVEAVDEPQPEIPSNAPVAAPMTEEAPPPRGRRRGRPQRSDAGGEAADANTGADENSTPDGAAALAAFPE
jgi:hypothetical protein